LRRHHNKPQEAFIVTPFSSAKVFEMHGPVAYFGIRFRPLGHHGIIAVPMGAWNNSDNVIDAYELLPKQVLKVLNESAYPSMSFQQRCDYYSVILLEVLHDREIDIRLLRFLQYCGQNIASTMSLSNKQYTEFSVSARQLRRLTSQYLGLSPKSFSKTLRFQQTLRMMDTVGSAAIWANAYYDQPHFIREFKRLSGVTPNEFKRLSVLYNTEPLKN
jgi:AraC-like DNA-binding protein